jgi:hypothetical protein
MPRSSAQAGPLVAAVGGSRSPPSSGEADAACGFALHRHYRVVQRSQTMGFRPISAGPKPLGTEAWAERPSARPFDPADGGLLAFVRMIARCQRPNGDRGHQCGGRLWRRRQRGRAEQGIASSACPTIWPKPVGWSAAAAPPHSVDRGSGRPGIRHSGQLGGDPKICVGHARRPGLQALAGTLGRGDAAQLQHVRSAYPQRRQRPPASRPTTRTRPQ